MRESRSLWSALAAGRNFASSVFSKCSAETTLRLDDAEAVAGLQEEVASERSVPVEIESWSDEGTSVFDASDVASFVSTDVPYSTGSYDDISDTDEQLSPSQESRSNFQGMVASLARSQLASERARANSLWTWGLDASEWPQFAVDRNADEVFVVEEGWAGLVVRPARLPVTPRIGRYRCSL
mmetsp:Transcript_89686/g.141615  ORF Transcript_89686/g.141615 Transcript_89686/m.141615 type:complete len:182 (+) Transcript_89686:66-611(+)